MADRGDLGPGEQAARARRRFMLMLMIGGGALGGILGGVIGGADSGKGVGFDLTHLTLSPVASVLMAAGFVLAMIGLPLFLFAKVDEMKAQRNLKAMTAGCLAVLGGYPAWQMLAAGGLLPQPSALGVCVIAYVVMTATSLALRLRG